jgi:hypothetical protein
MYTPAFFQLFAANFTSSLLQMPCGPAIINKKNNISLNFFHEIYLEPLSNWQISKHLICTFKKIIEAQNKYDHVS